MPNLKELLVSNNGLDPMATFTICVGARECPSMTYLCLDNNPVGDLGMRAILTNVVYCGSRLSISARGCDFTAASSECAYKRNDPTGAYDINLSNGFDRAILLDAMDSVAMHQSLAIEGFEYSYDSNILDMELTRFDEKRSVETFDRHENQEIDALHRMHRTLSNDRVKSKLIATFIERQHPGTQNQTLLGLYRDEATDIIEGVGRVEYSESQFKTLFAYFDVCDDSTIITSFMFAQIIDKVEAEALLRIRDACHIPRFSVNKGVSRYVPPSVGRIKMKVLDTFVSRTDGYGLTNYQTHMMHRMSQNHADVSVGLTAVMQLFCVRCEEATNIFHILMESTGDPANALANILPCLTTSPDIRAIINMYGRNATTQRRLEQRMGNAYRAYVGPTDGFYHIDLRVSTDRLCLRKLMQISAVNSHRRKRDNRGDISQHGDWSSFRNKHFLAPGVDGVGAPAEMLLNNAALTPMPSVGIIEFDFSGSPREYIKKAEANTNEWFVSTLVHLGLIAEGRQEHSLEWLAQMETKQRKNSTGAGGSLYQRDLGRSQHMSSYLYEKIYLPSQQARRHNRNIECLARERGLQAEIAARAKAELDAIEDARRQEVLEKKRGRASRPGSRPVSRQSTLAQQDKGLDDPATPVVPIKENSKENAEDEDEDGMDNEDGFLTPMRSTNDIDDGSGSMGELFAEGEGGLRLSNFENSFAASSPSMTPTDGNAASRRGTNIKKHVDRYALVKASKTLRAAYDTYDNGKLLYARQLALLLMHFHNGILMRSDFGSYRVELVINLFSKIKDIQNIDLVMSYLNATEAACVIGRLGFLTLFNPMKPENSYELDLGLWEQRQIAKMLMHYAVVEPGVNWFNQKYTVDRFSVNIPGWELPLSWNLKENLPERGILTCKYYAGDGFCMKQCRPVKSLRFNLLSLSLVSLDDLRDEEAEFLLDKSSYRQIQVADEVTATPNGKHRKHHAKFSADLRAPGSAIPGSSGSLESLNADLLRSDVTWNYNFVSDSHP
jgi:hypothetical protein